MNRALRLFLALLALLLLAGGGYTAYWWTAAKKLKESVAQWAETQRAMGFDIRYVTLKNKGFPFRLEAKLLEPSIGRPGAKMPWEWKGTLAVVSLSPFDFENLTLTFPGAHAFHFKTEAGPKTIVATAGDARALVHLARDGQPDRSRLLVQGLTARGIAADGPVTAESLDLAFDRHILDKPDPKVPGFSAVLKAQGVAWPGPDLPLPPKIGNAALYASLYGRIPPLPLAQALAQWNDDGGTLELESIELDWSPLKIVGNGTLALDSRLQPQFAGSAQINGFLELVDGLKNAGAIGSSDASVAKSVLQMMARQDPSGRAALAMGVSVQNGFLFVGPLRLMRFPDIEWPGAAPSPAKGS